MLFSSNPAPIAESFNYHDKISIYFRQNIRWVQNAFFFRFYKTKGKTIIRFIALILFSFSLLVFPFLIFINYHIFIIWLLLLMYIYLKKIREVIFFKRTTDVNYYGKLGLMFYFKIYFHFLLHFFILMILIKFF